MTTTLQCSNCKRFIESDSSYCRFCGKVIYDPCCLYCNSYNIEIIKFLDKKIIYYYFCSDCGRFYDVDDETGDLKIITKDQEVKDIRSISFIYNKLLESRPKRHRTRERNTSAI